MSNKEIQNYNTLSLEELQHIARKGRQQQNAELAAFVRQLIAKARRWAKASHLSRAQTEPSNANAQHECVAC